MELTTELLLGILTIATGAFGTWLTYQQKQVEARAAVREASIRREQAERDRSLTTNKDLIDQLQEEVKRLAVELRQARYEIGAVYSDLGKLRTRLIEIEIGAKILLGQVESLGHEPLWQMPPPIVLGKYPSSPTEKDTGT